MTVVAPGGRVDRSIVSEAQRLDLARALRTAVRGTVAFDAGTRSVYATDSSNYRLVPLGVVFPLDHDDVVAVRMFAEMFQFFNDGRAAALATVLFIAVLPVMYINLRNFRRQGVGG